MNREQFAKAFDVPCETMERIDLYVALLQKWARAINLLGPTEPPHLWERHIADSGQLITFLPDDARTWLDIGTGAGLPGFVIALMAKEKSPNLQVTLIESDQRKAAFLREASRQTDTPVTVVAKRTEEIEPKEYDIVSARAFAPLRRLLRHVAIVAPNARTILLLKGRTIDQEIDDALEEWEIDATTIPSQTDPDGSILRITSFTSRE